MINKTESAIAGYPDVISYETYNKIKEQMEKCICKVKIGETMGTGFFCKIPFPDRNNMLPVFITNNHILNRALLYSNNTNIKIYIKEDTDIKIVTNLNKRIKYTNDENEYDITIIEIKKEDNIKNYLELDDIIINSIIKGENKMKEFDDETIYVIQYPKGKLSVSYGRLKEINLLKNYEFNHKCSTDEGSSGSPILNLNNKVIGIHKNGKSHFNFNQGTFLNYPIKEFITLNFGKNNKIENISNNNLPIIKNNNLKENINKFTKIIPQKINTDAYKRNKIAKSSEKNQNIQKPFNLSTFKLQNLNPQNASASKKKKNLKRYKKYEPKKSSQYINKILQSHKNKGPQIKNKDNMDKILSEEKIKSNYNLYSYNFNNKKDEFEGKSDNLNINLFPDNSNLFPYSKEPNEFEISKTKYEKEIKELNDLYIKYYNNSEKFIDFIINKYPFQDYNITKDKLEKMNFKKKLEFIFPLYSPNNYGGKDNVDIYSEIYNLLACVKNDLKIS